MGVAETKEALNAEISKVCIFYYLQVWNEAFNQVGVEASSALRRAESVYYSPAIRALGSKANTASKEADEGKEIPTKDLPTANILPKEVELKRQQTLLRKWPMMPPCLQLPPKTPPRRKRLPTTWKLCWQLSLYLPRKTSKVKV